MNPLGFLRRAIRRLAGRDSPARRLGVVESRHLAEMQTLLLAKTYADLLAGGRGTRPARIAYVGNSPRLMWLTEAMADCVGGRSTASFFCGRNDDMFRPAQSLESLQPNELDVAFVSDVDPGVERKLLSSLQGLRDTGARLPTIRPIVLSDAHASVSSCCLPDQFNTCLNIHKLAVISLATYLAPRDGAVVECGVYLGGTTIWMGLLQRALGVRRPLFALDTFSGMPAPVDQDGQTIYQAGTFAETSLERVARAYRSHGVSEDIEIVPGLVQETFPLVWRKVSSIALALVDTDQYAGTIAALREIVPRLCRNGLIIVDDTTLPGVEAAIEEAVAAFPQLRRIRLRHNFDLLYADTDANFLSEPNG